MEIYEDGFKIEGPRDFAKCFLAWQRGSRGQPASLSQLRSFMKFMKPTVSNKELLDVSREVYSQIAYLMETDWLKTKEAKELIKFDKQR